MHIDLAGRSVYLFPPGHSVTLEQINIANIKDAASLLKNNHRLFGCFITDKFLQEGAKLDGRWFMVHAMYQGTKRTESIGLCCAKMIDRPKITAEVAIGIAAQHCGHGFGLAAHILLASHLKKIHTKELRVSIPHTILGQRRHCALKFARAASYEYHHFDELNDADVLYRRMSA